MGCLKLRLRSMKTVSLNSRFDEFALPANTLMDASVAIPAVKGRFGIKYGEHAHYFMNFQTSKGLRLRLSHKDIIRPGWERFKRATRQCGKSVSPRQILSPHYHYGFNLLEQVMLMTVPHTVTPLGNDCFIVNLWSWYGYLFVDCKSQTVTYHTLDDTDTDSVLGSQQWFDSQSGDLFAMSYSLKESLSRIENPSTPVDFRIFKHRAGESGTETVWNGKLSDYVHDIIVNKTRQYCVVCELGMYLNDDKNIIPSKVLVVDLKNNRHWILDRFIVAAHACFDPQDSNTVYFSNHNFEFQHSSLFQLMKKGSYSVKFRGPASIFRYELTPDGPRETGVFTRDDFYRLTNMHVFNHRGQKVIAAMGFPDEVFLIDANDMSFIRKIIVKDPVSIKHSYSKKPSLIGTIAPSPDGEKLFVQTTGSFQMVDIDTGEPDYIRDYFFGHICFNHMTAFDETKRGSGV